MIRHLLFALLSLVSVVSVSAAAWQSAIVGYTGNDLTYAANANADKFPDFSSNGYRTGDYPIPAGTVRATLSSGATAAQIATAIATASGLGTLSDPGVVLLQAGTYTLTGSQQALVNLSNVILRGVGSGTDPATNTIIRHTGTSQISVIVVGGTGSYFWTASTGTATNITDDVVKVRARSFTVASSAGFTVGDAVLLRHPSTNAWLDAFERGGVPSTSTPWQANTKDINYHRFITNIVGNVITVDAPFFFDFTKALSQCTMIKFNNAGRLSNIGVENLRITIDTAGTTSLNHANRGVAFHHADNCWATNVVVEHWYDAGFELGQGISRVTLSGCQALSPHGTPNYNKFSFVSENGQLILIKDSYAFEGAHTFSTNSSSGATGPSGVIFLRCSVDEAVSDSGGHCYAPQGLLYDSCTVNTPAVSPSVKLQLANNGNATGTGQTHGWGGINSVLWNTTITGGARDVVVQNPPLAQNFAIGTIGANIVRYSSAFSYGRGAPAGDWTTTVLGYVEGTDVPGLSPSSIYEAQLADRLGVTESFSSTTTLVDFGYKLTSSTTDIVVQVTNTSGAPVSGTVTEDSAHYSIQAGGTITSLADGASANITVRYSPTTAAKHTGTLSISGSAFTLPLTGVAASLQPTLSFSADAGTLVAPMVDGGSYVSSPTFADGAAVYGVTIATAGQYKLQALVNTPTASADSFFIDFDSVPGVLDISDVPLTSGFELRDLPIRGNAVGSEPSQFIPGVWQLSAGTHVLVVAARDENTQLASIAVVLNGAAEDPGEQGEVGTIRSGLLLLPSMGGGKPWIAPGDVAFVTRRINCGGPEYTDIHGNIWEADTGFTVTAGSTYTTDSAQAGTADDTLYRSERWDTTLAFAATVPNGSYYVNLHFSEIYFASAADRVSDYVIELVTVLDDFDIYVAAGNAANTAVIRGFPVTVADGVLNITATGSVDAPKISAVEILAASPPSVPPVVDDLVAISENGQIRLTWTKPATAASVNLYHDTTAGVTTADTKITAATSPYVLTSANGTARYLRAEAENATGVSALSVEVSATPVAPATGLVYYVAPATASPAGSDAAAGTIGAPLLTVGGLRDKIRVATGRTVDGTSTISGAWTGATGIFAAGTYPVTAATTFDERDGGTQAYPIIYRAADGAVVKLTGAYQVTSGWVLASTGDAGRYALLPDATDQDTYMLNVSALGINVGDLSNGTGGGQDNRLQLIVGNDLKRLSRWPNGDDQTTAGWVQMKSTNGTTSVTLEDPTPGGWTISGQNIRVYGPLEIPYYFDWYTPTSLSVASSDTVIAIGNYSSWATFSSEWSVPSMLSIRNALEALSQSGAYVWNLSNGLIYYLPETGAGAPTNTSLNVSLSLLALGSASDAAQATNWVTFKDMILEGTRASVITAYDSTGVVIDGCETRNFGGRYGAANMKRCAQSGFQNGSVHSGQVGAIRLHGGDTDTLTQAGNFIRNIEISHIGLELQAHIISAIELRGDDSQGQAASDYSCGITIENLNMHDCRDGGIGANAAYMTIQNSQFQRVCSVTGDAGVITVLGNFQTRYNVIKNCTFTDILRTTWQHESSGAINAIYADLVAGWTMQDNVFLRCDNGILIGAGKDHIIRRNKFTSITGKYGATYMDPRSAHTDTPLDAVTTGLDETPLGSAPWSTSFPLLIQYRVGGARRPITLYPENITFVDNMVTNTAPGSPYNLNKMIRISATDGGPQTVSGFSVGINTSQLNYPIGATGTPVEGGGTVALSTLNNPW